MKANTEEWEELKAWLIETYQPGVLIPHDELKAKLGIFTVNFSDYESPEKFVKGVQDQQFEYMAMVDVLREELLTNDLLYLANIRGLGYHFLHPWQQQEYAFDLTNKQIKSALQMGTTILQHVRTNELSPEAKKRGVDLSVKLSSMRQMFATVRRKS